MFSSTGFSSPWTRTQIYCRLVVRRTQLVSFLLAVTGEVSLRRVNRCGSEAQISWQAGCVVVSLVRERRNSKKILVELLLWLGDLAFKHLPRASGQGACARLGGVWLQQL